MLSMTRKDIEAALILVLGFLMKQSFYSIINSATGMEKTTINTQTEVL